MKTKKVKPIEYDIHFKYLCTCGDCHWLSLNEASTKNFLIVCDCGKKSKVKPIKNIQIIYKSPKNKKTICKSSSHNNNLQQQDVSNDGIEEVIDESITNNSVTDTVITEQPTLIEKSIVTEKPVIIKPEIPPELLTTCVNLLYTFGYNRKDATDLIKSYYDKYPVDEYKLFVKNLLKSIKGSK